MGRIDSKCSVGAARTSVVCSTRALVGNYGADAPGHHVSPVVAIYFDLRHPPSEASDSDQVCIAREYGFLDVSLSDLIGYP